MVVGILSNDFSKFRKTEYSVFSAWLADRYDNPTFCDCPSPELRILKTDIWLQSKRLAM